MITEPCVELVDYTVNVTNDGPDGATDVTVKDNLPDGVTVQSTSSTQGSVINQAAPTTLWELLKLMGINLPSIPGFPGIPGFPFPGLDLLNLLQQFIPDLYNKIIGLYNLLQGITPGSNTIIWNVGDLASGATANLTAISPRAAFSAIRRATRPVG